MERRVLSVGSGAAVTALGPSNPLILHQIPCHSGHVFRKQPVEAAGADRERRRAFAMANGAIGRMDPGFSLPFSPILLSLPFRISVLAPARRTCR